MYHYFGVPLLQLYAYRGFVTSLVSRRSNILSEDTDDETDDETQYDDAEEMHYDQTKDGDGDDSLQFITEAIREIMSDSFLRGMRPIIEVIVGVLITFRNATERPAEMIEELFRQLSSMAFLFVEYLSEVKLAFLSA